MSLSTFGITTYVEGTCPLGQRLARPLTVIFGRSFTSDLNEFEPALLERISLATLTIITFPLSLLAIGTGLILLSLSPSHHEARTRLVQDFAISPPELKERALKVTSALAQHVAIFNQKTRYSAKLSEILEQIKRLYFAIPVTNRQREWRFWQESFDKLCAHEELAGYEKASGELTPLEPAAREAVRRALAAVKISEGDQLRLGITVLLCKLNEIKTVEEVMAEMAFLQPQVSQSLPHVGIVNNPVDCVARALLRTPRPSLTDSIVDNLIRCVHEVKETLSSARDERDRALAAPLEGLEETPENERLLSQTVAALSDQKAKDKLQSHLDAMRACYLRKYTLKEK